MRPCDLYKIAKIRDGVELRDHQRAAVEKFDKSDGGILFAHEVGTGKTLTSIAAIEHAREKGRAGKTLVVTPAALRSNYIDNGVHKFTDRAAIKLGPKGESGSYHVSQSLPDADYYVVGMEMFRKDPEAYLKATGADSMVVDEIHKARDAASANYGSLMTARSRVKNFIGLSGTPVMNHPREIVPIMDIVTNKNHRLGGPPEKESWAGGSTPFGRRGVKKPSFDEMYMGVKSKVYGPLSAIGIGVRAKEDVIARPEELKRALLPHVHFASTKELGDNMPDKNVHDIEVEMSPHQRKLYDFSVANVDAVTRYKIRNNLPVSSSEAAHVFARIAQSRQASNGLHTLDRNYDPLRSALETPKAKRVIGDVISHLSEDPKNKAIIYTNLVHGGIDELHAGLKHNGYDPGLFIGSGYQNKREREQHINDYLDGRKRVMIINQAGTEGLNLPGTTGHFTMDPHFNPKVTEQAEARGIRAGSPVKEVQVYRYRSVLPRSFFGYGSRETSTDDWIYGIAARKEKLNSQFTDLLRGEEGA